MKNPLKGLTGLLGTVIISTACLTGCGKPDKLSNIYMIEGSSQYFTEAQSNEFTRIKSAGNTENLSELEKGKDYGHNPETGEVVEILGQEYWVTHLKTNNNPFKEETQEPEKQGQQDYITRDEMDNHYLPEISKTVGEVINERFQAYGFEEIPSEYQQTPSQPHQYQPQSNELMVPIEPSFPTTAPQRPRVNVEVNIPNLIDLPPARHRR